MELLKAVQESASLEKIKEIITSRGISKNSKWLDLTSLNTALENGQEDVASLLIDSGCRVNRITKPAGNNTPLHYAVKLKSMKIVIKLLQRKASIVATDANGDTPLHLAFMTRCDQIVDAMLTQVKFTKYVNPKDKQGITHFHIACIRNDPEVVLGFIQKGVDIEDPINSDSLFMPNYKPLNLAVEFTCLDVVKVLKDAGVENDLCSEDDIAPIHLATDNFRDASVINYLISRDSYEQLYKTSQMSNFHLACMTTDNTLVELFVENGVAINNAINEDNIFCPGYTPLHCAVESNCKENVELLRDKGARVDCQDKYYMTPLHLALYNDKNNKSPIVNLLYDALKSTNREWTDLNGMTYFHIACTRNDVEVVKRFLDRGVNVNDQVLYNLKNFAEYSPLHFAVQYSCKEVAELLIERGANINRSDNGMRGTPLHLAFESGDTKMIDLLLSHGAKVDIVRPYDKKTVLHLLIAELMDRNYCFDNPAKVLNVLDRIDKHAHVYLNRLVELGCNVNAKDSDGNTPLHLACSKIRDGLSFAKFLLDNGADINIENDEGDTAFDMSFCDIYRNNGNDYMMLYHHVQSLKALGLKVNPKNEKCCIQLLKDKDECNPEDPCFAEKTLALKQQKRLNEIEKLKSTKIDTKTSLYKVLQSISIELAMYARNEKFIQIVEAKDFRKEWPTYGYMLKLKYKLGLIIAEAQEATNGPTKTEKKLAKKTKQNTVKESPAKRRKVKS